MKNIIIGMAVGDAVGVPYEFNSSKAMKLNPCTDMIGYGTHGQPKGTWSDDTSMALCIVDSLCNGLNYTNIADKFAEWLYGNLWTPHGKVFDHGFATKSAIDRWISDKTKTPMECGGIGSSSNGNGSVMRTLALVPYIENYSPDIHYTVVSNISSITHAHWISKYSCYLVCEFAIGLRKGLDKEDAWVEAIKALGVIRDNDISFEVITIDEYEKYFGKYTFDTILEHGGDSNFSGSGFARDTAVTSIWCILTTDTYKEAVLKAVNYGDDTDTTACVTGGLGGILYGLDGIPSDWVESLARKDDIIDLVERYESTYDTV